MTWTPLFGLLLLVPALIALYFLKLRREDRVVSSTLLWKRSVEDFHVNAPFQKLRQNLLLLLQLLVLIGLILAAWRPRITGEGVGGRHLVVLIDNSASTKARSDGASRFERIREDALGIISTMESNDRMAVLSFAAGTVNVEPLTSDQGLLEARVEALEPSDLPTDLGRALRVASSVASALPEAEIHVIGDGCYGDVSDLPAEVKGRDIRFVSHGAPQENVGIIEMDIRRDFDGEGKIEAFVLVEKFGASDWSGAIALYVDDALRDAREVTVEAGKTHAAVFDCSDVGEGVVRAALDTDDGFPVDDQAWGRIVRPGAVRVAVVGAANPWLDLALKADAGNRFVRISLAEFESLIAERSAEEIRLELGADLVVFDREAPASHPPVPSIYIGRRPEVPELPAREDGSYREGGEGLIPPVMVESPVVVDFDRTHPLNRFIEYTDMVIDESLVYRRGGGYHSLVDSEGGSLIGTLTVTFPGGLVVPSVLIGFELEKSNWPIGHYSFPIFFSNATAWLGGSRDSGSVRFRTGDALVYRPPPEVDRRRSKGRCSVLLQARRPLRRARPTARWSFPRRTRPAFTRSPAARR